MGQGNKMGRSVLIVGGAGGLGSSLARTLCDSGKSVIVCDNVSTGNLFNIEDLYTKGNFEFIREDIAYLNIPRSVGTIVFLAKPDKFNPEAIFDTNLAGLRNCLDYCSDNVCRIIFASTPLPLSPIDGSKSQNYFYLTRQVGESMVSDFYQNYQIGSTILRMPSIYGDKDVSRGSLVWKFIEESISSGQITVNKDKHSARSYVHIEDMVDMLVRTIRSMDDGKLNIVDISSKDVLTASDLAKKVSNIIENMGKKNAIVHKGRRYGHKRAVASYVKSKTPLVQHKRLDSELESMIVDELKRLQ